MTKNLSRQHGSGVLLSAVLAYFTPVRVLRRARCAGHARRAGGARCRDRGAARIAPGSSVRRARGAVVDLGPDHDVRLALSATARLRRPRRGRRIHSHHSRRSSPASYGGACRRSREPSAPRSEARKLHFRRQCLHVARYLLPSGLWWAGALRWPHTCCVSGIVPQKHIGHQGNPDRKQCRPSRSLK
jgi:hypothetical protein